MASKHPVQGKGHFQWSRGGWFGSQLGVTAWLLPTGLIFLAESPIVGLIWLTLFVAINTIGTWMWTRRDRLDPLRATQVLLLVCGVGGLLAIGSLDLLKADAALPELTFQQGRFALEHSGRESFRFAYLFFLLGVPAMMGWMALTERAARMSRAKDPNSATLTNL